MKCLALNGTSISQTLLSKLKIIVMDSVEILEKLEVVDDYKEKLLSVHKRMVIDMTHGSCISIYKHQSRNKTSMERGHGHSVYP